MNKSSVFVTAFWTGLAGPSALYAETPAYRPYIANLTFLDSFALVGVFMNNAMCELNAGQIATDGTEGRTRGGDQLSFQFNES